MICSSRISRISRRQAEKPLNWAICPSRYCQASPWGKVRGFCLHFMRAAINCLFAYGRFFFFSLFPQSRSLSNLGHIKRSQWSCPRLNPEIVKQDYPNMKAAESWTSLVSYCTELAQLHPTVQEVPERECLQRKARTSERCGGEHTFISRSAFRMVWEPRAWLYYMSPWNAPCSVFSTSPFSFLFFECFRNERVFSSKLRWEANSWTV